MKDTENAITVHIHYDDEGQNVSDILNKSLWIFIKKEVEKLCSSNSWLLRPRGLII